MTSMNWSGNRIEILNPDGTVAVHSDMTREELTEALKRPDLPAQARLWGGLALAAMDERDGAIRLEA